MASEELKKKQSVIWGFGPYERLPEHYASLVDHLARAIAVRLARAGATVTGVDLAPALIETAKRIAAEEGLAISYQVGDAELLPYEDSEFDVVVSSIGSMFAPDHAVARELTRVCRAGGRLGLAHWSPDRGGSGHVHGDGALHGAAARRRLAVPLGRSETCREPARRGVRPSFRSGRRAAARRVRRGDLAALLHRLRPDKNPRRVARPRPQRPAAPRLRRILRRPPNLRRSAPVPSLLDRPRHEARLITPPDRTVQS
ncbi:MAG: methyltransferase domain-containing protein [Streptosporangiales bacterium]|nr:methyltransferase domain-containing protein [Streptosporangiales bacterium]